MNWKLIAAGVAAAATVSWAAYEWFNDDAKVEKPKPEPKPEPEQSECDKMYQECRDMLDEIRKRRGTEEEFLDAFSKQAEEVLKRAEARNSTAGDATRNNTSWSQHNKRDRTDPWHKAKSKDQRLGVWDSLWRGFTQVPVRDAWYQGEQPVGIAKDTEILEMLKDIPAVAFLTVDNRQGLLLRQGIKFKLYYQVTSGGINIHEWRDTPAGGWGKPVSIDYVINTITRAKNHAMASAKRGHV